MVVEAPGGWEGAGGGDVVVAEPAAYLLGVADHAVHGRQRIQPLQVCPEEAGGHDGVGLGNGRRVILRFEMWLHLSVWRRGAR